LINGYQISVRRKDLEAEDGCQDPNFFDEDYSIAASTGMVVWEGSWVLIEALRDPAHWLGARLRGKRVVELGAGTGLLGLCAAAAGASVLLTDVPAVVGEMLTPNLEANVAPGDEMAGAAAAGTAAGQATAGADAWEGAVRVGDGSAAAAALNWYRPIGEQIEEQADLRRRLDPREADVVLAAECVWLKELVAPFVATVLALLRGPRRPICLLCFRERAKEGSASFTAGSAVISEFGARGCEVIEHGEVGKHTQRTWLYELRLRAVEGVITR